jgi:hypothetical protein
MQYKGQEKAQSIIYKTLHRKLNIWQHELHLNLRLAQVTREDTMLFFKANKTSFILSFCWSVHTKKGERSCISVLAVIYDVC